MNVINVVITTNKIFYSGITQKFSFYVLSNNNDYNEGKNNVY